MVVPPVWGTIKKRAKPNATGRALFSAPPGSFSTLDTRVTGAAGRPPPPPDRAPRTPLQGHPRRIVCAMRVRRVQWRDGDAEGAPFARFRRRVGLRDNPAVGLWRVSFTATPLVRTV